jgi:hypothetical protein
MAASMRISVTCTVDHSLKLDVVVHSLSFDASTHTFSMPCPMGDDWLLRLNCPLVVSPVAIHFQVGIACIAFKSRSDSESFASWLQEAEAAAQHGYATMRG